MGAARGRSGGTDGDPGGEHHRRVDVVVVGAGLAGLTAAGPGRSVVLVEGHAGTNRAVTESVGRFLFNRGAHALYRKGAGRPVLARLGVRVPGGPPLRGAMGRRGDERPRLLGLAYRITGSRVDAEDVVQAVWERVRRAGGEQVDRPSAWLTTVVSRLALERLRAAQRRRESYVGPWQPDPVAVVDTPAGTAADPAQFAELAESLTFGFLRVLESLTPVERVVFVLADVFGVPFPEIAAVVARSPDACRQVASRARTRVRDERRTGGAADDAAQVAGALAGALMAGDTDRVLSLLAPDVVLVSEGGTEAHAARRPVVGPHRVGRLLVNLARRAAELGVRHERRTVNGQEAAVSLWGDVPVFVMAFTVVDGLVTEIDTVVSPAKLAALSLTDPIE